MNGDIGTTTMIDTYDLSKAHAAFNYATFKHSLAERVFKTAESELRLANEQLRTAEYERDYAVAMDILRKENNE